MPAGDTYRLSQLFLMANNPMQTDAYFRDDAGAGFGAMAAAWDSTFVANALPLLSQDLQLDGVRISDPVQRVLAGQVFPNTGTTGGVASPALPPASAVVVTLSTGIYGRGKSGRQFLPGMPEGVQLDGRVPPLTLASWQAAWDAMNAAMNSAGFTWIVPTINRAAHPPTYTALNPVVLLVARPILRQQKRRELNRSIRH